jgi:hypothetical protein
VGLSTTPSLLIGYNQRSVRTRFLSSLLIAAAGALACSCGFVAGVDFFDLERASGAGADAAKDAGDADDAPAHPASDAAKPGRIYVLGGTDDPARLPAVGRTLVSEIQSDGSLGPWSAASDLPLPRMYAPAVVGDDFIALVGGLTPGKGERANFAIGRAPGGVVTSFFESAEAFASPRSRAGAARHGDTVFVIGGAAVSGVVLDSIQKGVVTANGVGIFTAGRSLPSPLARMAVATSATALYVVGGDDGATKTATIRMASFAADDLSPFTNVGVLPSPRIYAQAIVHEKALVVVGGDSNRGLTDVLSFPLDANGGLGAPLSGMPLPASTSRHQLVRHGDHVYVIGGATGDEALTSTNVFVGDLTPDGFVSAWRATTPLPAPLIFHGAAAL